MCLSDFGKKIYLCDLKNFKRKMCLSDFGKKIYLLGLCDKETSYFLRISDQPRILKNMKILNENLEIDY